MTQHERPPLELDCIACGAALPAERLISLEIDTLLKEVAQLQHVLHHLKPMLITASYYLDQHAHLLRGHTEPLREDADLHGAREAQSRTLSSELMEAYCRVTEVLSLSRR